MEVGWLLFFHLSVSVTAAPIGMKFCMMLHISPGQVFSPLGAVAQESPKSEIFGPKF